MSPGKETWESEPRRQQERRSVSCLYLSLSPCRITRVYEEKRRHVLPSIRLQNNTQKEQKQKEVLFFHEWGSCHRRASIAPSSRSRARFYFQCPCTIGGRMSCGLRALVIHPTLWRSLTKTQEDICPEGSVVSILRRRGKYMRHINYFVIAQVVWVIVSHDQIRLTFCDSCDEKKKLLI
jgi:hypothetical protein